MLTVNRDPVALTIPNWHPARLNQWDGKHWGVRSRLKKADSLVLATYVAAHPAQRWLRSPQGPRRVSLRLYGWKRGRLPDPDAYWKSVLDGLVHAGVLRDDSWEHVELGLVVFARSEAKSTTILVSEVASLRQEGGAR